MNEIEEIKRNLKNWRKIIAPYQYADNSKAFAQVVNSILPFIIIWGLMYYSLRLHYGITFFLAIINALLLARIFIIQHDCGHQSFFSNSLWNNIVGYFCSLLSFIPYQYWAKVHNLHHAHNGQYEDGDIGDIAFLTVEEYQKLSGRKRFFYQIYRSPIMLFVIGPIYYVGFHIHFPFARLNWKSQQKSLFFNNLAMIGFYAFLIWLVGWKAFLLIHIPIVAMFSMMATWFFYVQHQHRENYKEKVAEWDYLLSAVRGSTYYKLPPLFMWFTGNIGYHHIHHLNPQIPNYHLPRCNRENPVLERYVTVLSFRDSLKCVQNHLWDEGSLQMISFKEFNKREKAGLLPGSFS